MIHPTAEVAPDVDVDPSTFVWQLAHVRESVRIGRDVVIGRGAYVGPGVSIGDRVKIQNYALIYEPAVVADGVFIGPAVVFTNDRYPRAVNPDGSKKSAADWVPVGVNVLSGASIGARAVCVAPVTIGRWSLVAAGSVVTADVADYAVVAGSPARRIGWVGPAGEPLVAVEDSPDTYACPRTGARFVCDSLEHLIEVEQS
jgi:acetyltransferase-like isoleucine patch superfamily enzyme